jgi:ATP-dependent DNA ligase
MASGSRRVKPQKVGENNEAIAKGDRLWQSKPADAGSRPATRAHSPILSGSSPLRKFLEPLKERLAESAPAGDWLYEIKFDGFRALPLMRHGWSQRNEKDLGGKFPEVTKLDDSPPTRPRNFQPVSARWVALTDTVESNKEWQREAKSNFNALKAPRHK